jgi:hypothetical protein
MLGLVGRAGKPRLMSDCVSNACRGGPVRSSKEAEPVAAKSELDDFDARLAGRKPGSGRARGLPAGGAREWPQDWRREREAQGQAQPRSSRGKDADGW